MDAFVSIVKLGIKKTELTEKNSLYKKYYPNELETTNLQQNLYTLWFFWLKIKKLDGTIQVVFDENTELYRNSVTCIKYKLTKPFCRNIRTISIICPTNKEYMYVYIGADLSKQYLNETMVESLLSYNSLHLLYYGKPLKYGRYGKKLLFYREQIQQHNFDLRDFVIVSSGILGMYGMREPTDIDMVTLETNYKEICDELIDCHHHVLETYEITVEELVLNPNKYVYWNGVKFAALDVVYKACNNRIENTKKLDAYFIRVIWGEEPFSILELTKKRVRHYFIRTIREWKKNHSKYFAWKYIIKDGVIFCCKNPDLVLKKIYRLLKGEPHEKN